MRVAELNGTRLHWREDGDPDGAPVVFANSLGTDLRLWDAILPLLPEGLRFIRYDKRGHGLSDCPPGPYSIDMLAEDAGALIDMLDLRDPVFVGLSIGGMIGQCLAAKRPGLLRALVLSNTAAQMGTPEMWEQRMEAIRQGGIAAVAGPVLERWFAPDFRARPEAALWGNMLERTPKDGYLACCAAIAAGDLREGDKGLDLPVLAIAGELDGASPPDVVGATAALIPGARFEIIKGAGHLPCAETPEEHAALIGDFLKETGHVRAL